MKYTKLVVEGEEVELDPSNLTVDEVGLNDFLKTHARKFGHYSQMLTLAQNDASLAADQYQAIYDEKFADLKEATGGSDKLVEAKARSCAEVKAARDRVRDTKHLAKLLETYVKAMERAHQDALNLGYNLRREMTSLGGQSINNVADNHIAKYAESYNGNSFES